VRRYLDALIAGENTTASAVLAPGGTLKEAAFLDDSARVTGVHVTRSDTSGAFVQADIAAKGGNYVATFHVANGGSIDEHDYIKI
jgi:hypothetical protein